MHSATSTATSIIIADDHSFFRSGLKQALTIYPQIDVIAEASNGKELCSLVQELKPSVVVTDISMPEMNGVEAAKWIKEQFPTTGIVALSMHEEADMIRGMFLAGANAYLLKNADTVDVTDAINAAGKGMFYFSTTTAHYINNILQYKPHTSSLTKREVQIIQLLFDELTSKQIGEKLYLSERTVEDHRKHIQQKTGAKNVVGLIKYALINNIVKLKNSYFGEIADSPSFQSRDKR